MDGLIKCRIENRKNKEDADKKTESGSQNFTYSCIWRLRQATKLIDLLFSIFFFSTDNKNNGRK